MQLSVPSGRMLTIAKELYIQGVYHSQKKSIADSMLAILNFDFAGETILKAVLLNNGGAISRPKGGFKTFDEIIQDFKLCFHNIYTDEVNNLHKLRNDVQHHSNIPSEQEVIRHKNTIQLFFNEVCSKAYNNAFSYERISVALFIDSKHEKVILDRMEEEFGKGNYPLSAYYAKKTAIYHLMLLRLNLHAPNSSHINPFSFREFGSDFRDVIQEISRKLDWVVDKLCLREHYDTLNEMLGGNISSPYFLFDGDFQPDPNTTYADAEKFRNQVYSFITSTQDMLIIHDLKQPFVYHLIVTRKVPTDDHEAEIGVLSTEAIKMANLRVSNMPTKEDRENHIPQDIRELKLSNDCGIQVVTIEKIHRERPYIFSVSFYDKNNKTGSGRVDFMTSP